MRVCLLLSREWVYVFVRCRNTKSGYVFCFSCVCLLFLSLSFGVFPRICVTDCIFFWVFLSFNCFLLLWRDRWSIQRWFPHLWSGCISIFQSTFFFSGSYWIFSSFLYTQFSRIRCFSSRLSIHVVTPFSPFKRKLLGKKSYHFIGEKNIGRVGGHCKINGGPHFFFQWTVQFLRYRRRPPFTLFWVIFYFIEQKTGNSRFSVANAPFFVFVSFWGFVQQKKEKSGAETQRTTRIKEKMISPLFFPISS